MKVALSKDNTVNSQNISYAKSYLLNTTSKDRKLFKNDESGILKDTAINLLLCF